MNSFFNPAALLSAAALALISSGASAQQVLSNTWSGPYLGVVGGAQRATSHFSLPGDTADVLISDHDANTSALGGLVAGFNYEMPVGLILGIEGDVTAGKNRLDAIACTTPDGCWTPTHDSFTTFNHLTTKTAGHVRVKVGVATGANLFYAAGGYSVGKARLDLVGECFNPADPTTPLLFTFNRSKTMSGFNLGAGYERQIGKHMGVRAEYLYDDFGDQLFRGDGTEWNDRRVAARSSTLRIGVDFKF
jgi:opacity protein-like surface antigen